MINAKIKLNTILGQIDAEESFVWDAHVHLWGSPYHSVSDPDLILKDEAASTEELKRFYAAGGNIVAEFSTYDFGRDWSVLRRISKNTGVHIIAGSGFYRSEGLESLLASKTKKEWVGYVTNECLNGEEKTGAKPSFLKWSTSFCDITEAEKESGSIIAEVHNETGLPVVTHTQRGTMVKEQIQFLKNNGVDFSKLLISHIDMRTDLCADSFLEVLDTGAHVSIDQLGKPKYGNEETKINIILELCNRGYSDQILLATDIGRKSNFKVLGGSPGIEHIPAVAMGMLRDAGCSEALLKKLVSINPTLFYGVKQ